MANIARQTGNVVPFASESTGIMRYIFGTTGQGDTLDQNVTADFIKGWEVVSASDEPPIQWFNGLAYTLATYIAYLHQRGVADWDVAQEYYAGAIVNVAGDIYVSLTTNVGVSPINDIADWKPLVPANFEFVLPINSTTPSVTNRMNFKTANSTPTTISAFTGGTEGKLIRIRATDTNTTIAASLTGTGVAVVMAVDDIMTFQHNGTVFVQEGGNVGIGATLAPNSVTATEIANNAVGQSEIASGAVHTAELNTSTSTVTGGIAGTTATPTNSGYLFWPKFNGSIEQAFWESTHTETVSNIPIIRLKAGTGTLTATFLYVNSSPPHKYLDSPDYGQFTYVHRNKITGEVIATVSAPDPIWAGPWSDLPKNHPARALLMPHPFVEYHNKPLPDDEEIVLLDLRELNVEEEVKTESDRLNKMIAMRPELVLAGCNESELIEEEEKQREEATKEAQEISEATDKIAEAKDKKAKSKGSTKEKATKEYDLVLKSERPKLRLFKKHDLIKHSDLIEQYKGADKTVAEFPKLRVVKL